jgi:hypothetical protein
MEPSRNSTQISWAANSDTHKRLLFVLGAILLVLPSHINGFDEMRVGKSIGERHVMTILAKNFQIADHKGHWVAINCQLDLAPKVDMIFLCPFGKPKASVNTTNFPIVHNLVNKMGCGRGANSFLELNHIGSKGFMAILHILPFSQHWISRRQSVISDVI